MNRLGIKLLDYKDIKNECDDLFKVMDEWGQKTENDMLTAKVFLIQAGNVGCGTITITDYLKKFMASGSTIMDREFLVTETISALWYLHSVSPELLRGVLDSRLSLPALDLVLLAEYAAHGAPIKLLMDAVLCSRTSVELPINITDELIKSGVKFNEKE